MRTFDEIFEIAAERHPGTDAIEQQLEKPKPVSALTAVPEDRWLAQMTRSVFQSGFNWKVIEAKWDGFETAFHGFDVDRNAMMNDEDLDRLLTDKAIVRNGSKIIAVRDNAIFISELRKDGGIGAVIANWPDEDYVGLLEMLKKRGARLGGITGQYVLRVMGKDAFILSRDVVGRLVAEGVVDKPPTSKKALLAVQDAFNAWRAQSGRSFNEISRVLALSV